MNMLQSWMGDYFWWIVGLALIAIGWTAYMFSRRKGFQGGPKKGEAQNPGKVRGENPPDPPTADSGSTRLR